MVEAICSKDFVLSSDYAINQDEEGKDVNDLTEDEFVSIMRMAG